MRMAILFRSETGSNFARPMERHRKSTKCFSIPFTEAMPPNGRPRTPTEVTPPCMPISITSPCTMSSMSASSRNWNFGRLVCDLSRDEILPAPTCPSEFSVWMAGRWAAILLEGRVVRHGMDPLGRPGSGLNCPISLGRTLWLRGSGASFILPTPSAMHPCPTN